MTVTAYQVGTICELVIDIDVVYRIFIVKELVAYDERHRVDYRWRIFSLKFFLLR